MKIMNARESKNVAKETVQIVEAEGLSKSAKMKELFLLGHDVKSIAGLMGVRYNFVYNVVSNFIITDGVEVATETTTSKKDVIRSLFTQGKTSKEIAIELKTNLNYVYKIINEIKEEQELAAAK